jgi:monoamine oxidase
VAIVGAGLAGLAAAHELGKRGAETLIFDARERVGGRVWTSREFSEGRHAELGADLIDDEQDRLLQLAKGMGCEPVRILRGGFGFHAGNGDTRAVFPAWTKIEERLKPLVDAYCLSEQRWDTAIARGLSAQSVAEWLKRVRATAMERRLLTGMRGFFLADPPELSLLMLVDQFASGGNPAEAKMYRLRDGNDSLPRALARRLPGPLHLQAVVLSVATSTRGVRLLVAGRDGRRSEVRADYAVVTAPASTLRDIEIRPALPPRQRQAIGSLVYGRATRVLAEFDRRFWRAPMRRRAFGTDADTGAVWDGNEQQGGRGGILSLLAGGSASEGLQRLVSQGGRALARELAWLGSRGHVPRTLKMVVWEKDPWARGGYAVFTAGYDPELRAWLSRPHGRIVFAGEHTSIKSQGYMNGAVESGLRAVEEIAVMTQDSKLRTPQQALHPKRER